DRGTRASEQAQELQAALQAGNGRLGAGGRHYGPSICKGRIKSKVRSMPGCVVTPERMRPPYTPLFPLDLPERVVQRVAGGPRARRAEHHAHQRVLVAVVAQSTVNPRRNGAEIALAEMRLPSLPVLLEEKLDLAAHHEEHLLHVRVDMERSLASS